MDTKQLAATLTKNPHTEAEQLTDDEVALTVRPQSSSRTFRVVVRVIDTTEV